MDEVIRGFDLVLIHIDDVFIASSSTEHVHLQHLCIFFDLFKSYVVVIDPLSSILGVAFLKFQGHHIDARGIKPLQENVETTINYSEHKSPKSL